LRSAYRYGVVPTYFAHGLGFRIAKGHLQEENAKAILLFTKYLYAIAKI
jgi:hypothetical protein